MIGSIARLVKGHPLALELAAAASRDQNFQAIADAIATSIDALRSTFRDLPDRHRSVRATLDYSWQLLDARQQDVLARLGVFRGGFTAESAAAVANSDASILDKLIDTSMVRRNGSRFDMHELVRRYALERLQQHADEAHAALFQYVTELAQHADRELNGPEQEQWLAQLIAEHDNMRAALTWAIEQQHTAQAQQLGTAMARFWWIRGHQQEGRVWLQTALALPEDHSAEGLADVGGAGSRNGAGSR